MRSRGSWDHGRDYWRREMQAQGRLPELTADNIDDATFRLFADHIPTLCWIAKADGYIVWYNRRWHDYCGTTIEEMEGWGWQGVHDPDRLPEVMERWQSSIATGEPFEMSFPLKGADGVFRPFLTRVHPVRDGTGEVARWFGVNTEISAAVAAEEALRQSEERLRAIFDATPECIKIVAEDGTLIQMNASGLSMIEAEDPQQVEGACIFDVIHPDHRAQWEERHRRVCAGESLSWEFDIVGLAGTRRRMETHAVPLPLPAGGTAQLAVTRDVTTRKDTEDALREVAERYRAAVAATRDAVWDWDLSSDTVQWNEALGTGFGHDLETIDHTGDWWVAQIHPDDRGRVKKSITAAIGGDEQRWSEEYRFARADGSFAPVLDRGSIIRDEGGEAVRMIGAMFDLTERKEAEDALRESEAALLDAVQRLDAIINNTRMAIFMMDDRQHCIFANPAAEEMTGYIFAEMQGRPLHDVIHHRYPDGRPYPLEECPIDRAFPEEDQTEGEELFVHKDGSFYPVAFTASPVRGSDGRTVGTVIEARGIAEEKARDEALLEESGRLETLNRTGAVLAAELDLERVVQTVTDSGVELTGAQFGAFFYNTRDEAGERMTLYTISGVDRAEFDKFPMPRKTDIFAPTFDGDCTVRSDDITQDRRYGHNKPHNGMPAGHLPVRSYLAVPVTSRSGEVLGGLFFGHEEAGRFTDRHEHLVEGIAGQAAVAIDNAQLFDDAQRKIAEKRRAEDALRELNQSLETRVARAIEEREQAEEALRQSQTMEAVGQLTGGIAHDFNNLLTVVVGNIDMATRALGTSDGDARVRRALDGAQKGAQRASALTQRLLAFSRRQPLDPKPVEAGKLVLGMSDLLNRALGETVKLDIVTSPSLWRTEIDPNQLESALINLAVNARDAMPEGGQLTIELSNARLDEDYTVKHAEVAPGQYVMIAVTDTGSGMPRHLLEKVFEPFFTTKEVGKGTGLGLSMVYGFVKQSGGHVKIYSEEGQGTTVKLYLPRMAGAVSEAEEDRPTDGDVETSAQAEHILVVEDDEDVRSYTVDCLRELGYRVSEAPDGPTALALVEKLATQPDLLFTDVVMPEMSGQELATRLRERQSGLRVLYTSGYTRDAIVHGGRLDAGVEMIAKPFTYTALAQKLRDVLERGQTGRLLVVEEDPTVRSLAGEVLTRTGFTVEEAATPVEALAKVRSAQGRYDCIFLDAGFPERMVEEFRALHADLPILIAARAEQEDDFRDRHADDRCIGIVIKPYTGAQLEEALGHLSVSCAGSRD